MSPVEAKRALRAEIKRKLMQLSDSDITRASDSAMQLLGNWNVFRGANTILFYYPIQCEINIWPLAKVAMKNGKVILLPKFNDSLKTYEPVIVRHELDLSPRKFQIPEPDSDEKIHQTNKLDLLLVPGVAFALDGSRLGRGKGYYDRLLAVTQGIKCGVCWDFQVLDNIPAEMHDKKVDFILTPTRIISTTSRFENEFSS